ncbi:MAG: ribosome small subunit-dependent GTPase A [Moraxellaceae bacterium]|nr:ribosome small subunit-dependent GTPase A [Pseudobdellovibrionaceae bacterium]
MIYNQKEFLLLFGWNDSLGLHQKNLELNQLIPARVIVEEKHLYRVQVGIDQTMYAAISGPIQNQARKRADYPAVGDWVLISIPENSERGIIHHIMPRKTILHRKQIGSSQDAQILSTNVDTVFITTSVNDDLNYRRTERYLSIVRESGAQPVILLTKADIASDIQKIIRDVEIEFPGISVYAICHDEFEKSFFLFDYLKEGSTSVFIGSSGVGKSTLVNYLIGRHEAKTQEIRDDDGKGKHTTTSRHLYVSTCGGLIIDTPGMRELQMSDHADGVRDQFAEIEELAQKCKFTNCEHQVNQPGCAVQKSLLDQTLSATKWMSFQKLKSEVKYRKRT